MNYKELITELLLSINRPGIDCLIQFLNHSDFFKAPASTKYHGSFPGGLAQHSFKVCKILERKNEMYHLDLSPDTVKITGLLHDVCKIDIYTVEERWRKDDQGRWESYTAYVVKDKAPWGHGEKSVIVLQEFIDLTSQEIAMIRWHMGFSIPREEWIYLNNALESYPEIIALYSADLEVSRLLEKRGDELQKRRQ